MEMQVLHYLNNTLNGSTLPERQHGNARNAIVPDVCLDQVLEYMREYYASAVSIEDLAAIAGQSRYHFMRMFRA